MKKKASKSKEKELFQDILVVESGDEYDKEQYYQDGELASWRDVCRFIFIRSFPSWISLCSHFILFNITLYGLLLGTILLGTGAEVTGGCHASSLLEKISNPVTNVLIGMISTCIFQSSAATNYVISGLVVNGMSIEQGIFIAMGANVGNTISNTILALAHFMNTNELERVVAGASVNDFYFFYAIIVFLPIEAASKMLYHLAGSLVPENLSEGYQWGGFVTYCITPLVNTIIISNQALIASIASGEVDGCDAVYPVSCTDEFKSFDDCAAGMVSCDGVSGDCPFLFKAGASKQGDMSSGIIAMAIAVGIIFLSILGMVKLINRMIVETPVEVIARVTNVNSYVAMLLGCCFTVVVGSSSVAESVLNPFVASGVVELEQMFPWSLGGNVGMALFILLQSFYSGNAGYFHVSLANLFFNVFGILVWYPLPYLRKFPLHSSLILGVLTRKWRIFCFLHLAFVFFLIPFMFLGITDLLSSQNNGLKALGIVILVVVGLIMIPLMLYWSFGQGKEKFIAYFERGYNKEKEQEQPDEEDISYQDSFSEATSFDGGSEAGGMEVKYKEKDSGPTGILKKQKRFPSDLIKENSQNGLKSKSIPKTTKRKRLLKTRPRQPIDTNRCCADVNACGIGA